MPEEPINQGLVSFWVCPGANAANNTVAKFSASPLAITTGIVEAAKILGQLTNYTEKIGGLSEDRAGSYCRWSRTIIYPSSTPSDDVALHELAHVYNQQFTTIGGLTATSRSEDEGMAYELQNVYSAASQLQLMESYF